MKKEECTMKKEYDWMIGPFVKAGSANPCLTPKEETAFYCPVNRQEICWEAKDVFNPAAVVRDDKVYLLYRAEDREGTHAGTSRVGLAVSNDGLHFETLLQPVLYPEQDEFREIEWDGGCEDPRIIEREDGQYFLYYTAYDGKIARLCCAESEDLLHWKKHGPVFGKALNGKYAELWSKSGAVVCERKDSHFYAAKIQGKYWMYWGETNIYAAVSDNLKDWEPVEFLADGADNPVLFPVIAPRKGRYDEVLCEPGPQAVLTENGIVLLYNGKGPNPEMAGGHDTMYQAGQLLLDPDNPVSVFARTREPFISPSEPFELNGQVMPTCFIEGMVYFKEKYYLYYGTADSKIAVAVADGE
ncbi:MAG: hypothetical protein KH828_03480 [Clostridiales bacterium]|nr:hypothetical protein [Clostridiales bacterium]